MEISVHHFSDLFWGCDPSIDQPPTQKWLAPTWKASTLNLQCFDYTTAAQLFHHQLAFHVASCSWLVVVSAYLLS